MPGLHPFDNFVDDHVEAIPILLKAESQNPALYKLTLSQSLYAANHFPRSETATVILEKEPEVFLSHFLTESVAI